MSRIADMVEQLAPLGVRHLPVGKAMTVLPTARGIKRQHYADGKLIPIVDQGQSRVAGYTDDRSTALPKGEYVVFGDHTRAVKWVDFEFAPGADGTKVLVPAGELVPKFAYYALASLDIPSRGYNRHWTVLRDLKIPIPPQAVQREIVRVLDQFTELETELQTELETRRVQYVYYRDSLLAFPQSTRRASIGELGSIYGGLTGKSKADFTDGNARFVSYVNVFKNIAVDSREETFVRVGPNEKQRSLQRGDILFTGSSETADEVGMSSVVTTDIDEPIYLNSFCIGFRPTETDLIDPDFAKHLFRSSGMRRQIVRTASGVTRFNVSKARLAKVEVPIPSKDEQRRLASLLDSFEALVNNTSFGLPAELRARRKQYEYYRDKLLTFEELPA